jgi:hypothetical protein
MPAVEFDTRAFRLVFCPYGFRKSTGAGPVDDWAVVFHQARLDRTGTTLHQMGTNPAGSRGMQPARKLDAKTPRNPRVPLATNVTKHELSLAQLVGFDERLCLFGLSSLDLTWVLIFFMIYFRI